jgi:glycine/D-amino acid oxidase-like deaminating enzyme
LRIVIIGAGIVGSAIAYRLAQRPSLDVTVIDQAPAGSGASGHSFAWTNAFDKPPRHYHDLNRRSMDLWHGFVRELGVPGAYGTGGNLVLENDEERGRALRARVAGLQAWGYSCHLVDADELASLEPALAAHRFTAACYAPREGHVDVATVVRACLAMAHDHGASINEHAGTVTLRIGPGGAVEGVETAAGAIACDVVVVAAGTETPSIVAPAHIAIAQVESPGIVVRTDPRPRLLHSLSLVHLPAIDPARREVHLRQLPDGTLQMGQGTQESLDRDCSQAHADDLLARAAHYFPDLRGATAIPQPVGYRPMPADGLPVLGFATAAPNVYVAMMHSGVTLAPLIGELATLEIAEGVKVDWLGPYRPERFAV